MEYAKTDLESALGVLTESHAIRKLERLLEQRLPGGEGDSATILRVLLYAVETIRTKYAGALSNTPEGSYVASLAEYYQAALARASPSPIRRAGLNYTLDEMGLSNRVRRLLYGAGLRNIDDLIGRDASDLLSIRYFGRKSLKEVQTRLRSLDLSLRTNPPLVPR